MLNLLKSVLLRNRVVFLLSIISFGSFALPGKLRLGGSNINVSGVFYDLDRYSDVIDADIDLSVSFLRTFEVFGTLHTTGGSSFFAGLNFGRALFIELSLYVGFKDAKEQLVGLVGSCSIFNLYLYLSVFACRDLESSLITIDGESGSRVISTMGITYYSGSYNFNFGLKQNGDSSIGIGYTL